MGISFEDKQDIARMVARRVISPLVKAHDLADDLGLDTRTLYARMDKLGIPKRDMHGKIREKGARTTVYLFRWEWAEKKRASRQRVTKIRGRHPRRFPKE